MILPGGRQRWNALGSGSIASPRHGLGLRAWHHQTRRQRRSARHPFPYRVVRITRIPESLQYR